MPAIRGVYDVHPVTAEPGLWLDVLCGVGLVGQTKAEIAALVPGGATATKLQRFQDALNAKLNSLVEVLLLKSDLAPDDPIILTNTPEPGCRFEKVTGTDYYVARIVEVFVEALSISPSIVLGPVTVSDAASYGVWL